MKYSLAELKKAVTPKPTEAMAQELVANKAGETRRAMMMRMIANEFLANGLDLKKAYEAVTNRKYSKNRMSMLMGDAGESFLSEVVTALDHSAMEKDRVLALLWAQATVSPIDFMDNDGNMMSISDMKKLPRTLIALIEHVSVKTTYEHVFDDQGNQVKDDKGRPLMVPKQHVTIRLPNKQAALNTVAQIGKLIGAPGSVNNTINIGTLMVNADQRRSRMLDTHDIEGRARRLEQQQEE